VDQEGGEVSKVRPTQRLLSQQRSGAQIMWGKYPASYEPRTPNDAKPWVVNGVVSKPIRVFSQTLKAVWPS
jgi:hypothetical protein